MPTAKKTQTSIKTPTKTVGKSSDEIPTEQVGNSPAAPWPEYRITPTAAAALVEIAGQVGIAPSALVDLAVREWCRTWSAQH